MTNVEKVRLLLLSMDDHLPDPRPARLYESSEPGAQASAYVRCPTCSGCGRVVGADEPCMVCLSRWREGNRIRQPRHGCRMCIGCDGRGERKRKRGDEPFEAYSGRPMAELGNDPPQTFPSKATGAVLSLPEAVAHDFPWVRQRERLEAAGSYRELRKQLEWLRDRHIGRYETLMHWLSSQSDRWWSWSPEAMAGVDSTVLLLARRMPEPIRVPSWVRRGAA